MSKAAVTSFSLKLARADEHLTALNNEVVAFLKVRPYEVVTEAAAGRYSARVVYRQTPPDLLLMLIGDVLSNLRAALDHMAWSLAGAHADSRTEFPIFLDRDRFHGAEVQGPRGKLHDMSTCAQRIIEQMQPYHGLNGQPEEEPLWLLHLFSIEDKHRALNLVAAGIDIHLQVQTNPQNPAAGLTGRTGDLSLKDGEEIYGIPVRDPSQVKNYSSVTFDVAFDPEGPSRGSPLRVRNALSDMRESVAWALRSLRPFIP
jgi:hypothetical protein